MWLLGVSIQSKLCQCSQFLPLLWDLEPVSPGCIFFHKIKTQQHKSYIKYVSFSLHRRVLPVVLDVGTNNETLRNDPR